MKLGQNEFTALAEYIRSVSGVCYEQEQHEWLETLLLPLAQRTQSDSFTALLNQVRSDASGLIRKEMIDLVAIHETRFFREQNCFTLLGNQLIPDALSRSPDGIKIWSAGCSTGQEPFSVALTATERIGLSDVHNLVQIFASDISHRTLTLASEAEYNAHEMDRGLPQHLREKYFNPFDGYWKLDDSVRSLVCFQEQNLLAPLQVPGPFDIILLRNVAIYFDEETTANVYRKVIQMLKPGGVLLLGGTELLKTDEYDVDRLVGCGYPYFQRQQ